CATPVIRLMGTPPAGRVGPAPPRPRYADRMNYAIRRPSDQELAAARRLTWEAFGTPSDRGRPGNDGTGGSGNDGTGGSRASGGSDVPSWNTSSKRGSSTSSAAGGNSGSSSSTGAGGNVGAGGIAPDGANEPPQGRDASGRPWPGPGFHTLGAFDGD